MKAVLKNYDCFISLGYDAAPLMDYFFSVKELFPPSASAMTMTMTMPMFVIKSIVCKVSNKYQTIKKYPITRRLKKKIWNRKKKRRKTMIQHNVLKFAQRLEIRKRLRIF